MSYCRIGPHSDAYVIKSITGEWVCWARGHSEFAARHPSTMFIHLLDHRKEGHKIPDLVFARLKEDIKEFVWESGTTSTG